MFILDSIEGIDSLRKDIPDELQYWHKFGNISELHYKHIFDDKICDDIGCIDLFLMDSKNKYTIHRYLYNVEGTFNIESTGRHSNFRMPACIFGYISFLVFIDIRILFVLSFVIIIEALYSKEVRP